MNFIVKTPSPSVECYRTPSMQIFLCCNQKFDGVTQDSIKWISIELKRQTAFLSQTVFYIFHHIGYHSGKIQHYKNCTDPSGSKLEEFCLKRIHADRTYNEYVIYQQIGTNYNGYISQSNIEPKMFRFTQGVHII